jgi:FMN phosphatase YigB (HAD superfamily)
VPSLAGPINVAPRAIIFDIGRVIIRVQLSRAFTDLGAASGLSAEQVWKAIEPDPRWGDWQEGRMTPRNWHEHLTKKFSLSFTFDEFCETWNRVLDPVPILPESLFETLAVQCRLALLSNTDPIHVAHIEATYPFVRHFPVRSYSCRVGSIKPGPSIYLHALQTLNVPPNEALYIDDIHEYSAAAGRLGLNAFHFTSPGELYAEFSRLGLIPL